MALEGRGNVLLADLAGEASAALLGAPTAISHAASRLSALALTYPLVSVPGALLLLLALSLTTGAIRPRAARQRGRTSTSRKRRSRPARAGPVQRGGAIEPVRSPTQIGT